MTCLMGAYVLKEVMLCKRAYLMGGHALQKCMSSGWHILRDDVLYWKTCLIGGHALQADMSYRSTRFIGWDTLQES